MWFNVLMGLAIIASFLAGVGIGFLIGAFGGRLNEYD